ncbi:hypothetical protein TNCV_1557091 [Trichonephila clavipes]|nr:hypothetical protein TNCV_1557091 [Trichonephila clavipes]
MKSYDESLRNRYDENPRSQGLVEVDGACVNKNLYIAPEEEVYRSQLFVGIAVMGKMPHLDVFDREQILGAPCKDYSISELVRQLGFSRLTVPRVYQENMDGGQKKISDRVNCK